MTTGQTVPLAGRPPPPDQPAIYSEQLVRDLPGLFFKRAFVQSGETGVLVEKGQVLRTLRPGRHTVGWRFLSFGPWHRAVGRWRTDTFSLPLRFYRLGDDWNEPLDGFTQATVVVAAANAFYRFGVGGRLRLTATQLGSAAAASIQAILDRLAASFDPAALKGDPAAQEKLTEQVAPLLEEQLRDRGMRLEKLYPLLFRSSKEGEALLEEALALQAEIAAGQEADAARLRQKVELFAGRALEIELASASELDALRAAAASPGTDTVSVLTSFMKGCVDRLTGQVGDRAQRLQARGKPTRGSGPLRVSLAWIDTMLGWVVLAVVVVAAAAAGPLYPVFRGAFNVDPRAYFSGSYGAVFLTLMAAQFVRWSAQQWERWKQKQASREVAGPTWFERWLTRDAPQVDEVLRHQIATELEHGPMADLREAMAQAHRDGRGQEAHEARRWAEELRYLAQGIKGAEYASTAVPSDGRRALQQGARLVAFEEESLRLARIVAGHAGEVKARSQNAAGTAEPLRQVGDAVDALRRHFANRAGLLAGAAPALTPDFKGS